MKKNIIFIVVFTLHLFAIKGSAQTENSPKVILITLDGLRWQELYTGADSLLVTNNTYVNDTTKLKADFWRPKTKDRREALMPFFWKTIASMGQLHGNRNVGSKVNLTNMMWFSYPGYNEILTGVADDKNINSNKKINNSNKTVLEITNNLPGYKGKVAAFGSWDVFPFIINEDRSGVLVNAGFEAAKGNNLSRREVFLNQLQDQIPSPWSTVRLDAFTHHYAIEHMKKNHPDLMYIAYGETDDFAHDGDYEAYLKAAHNTDGMIKELWEFTQQDSYYKDNTVFIISTDHGRGTDPLDTWKSHGSKVKNAGEVWIVAFGKEIAALGEVKNTEQLYSNQIAATVAAIMGNEYSVENAGKPIESIVKSKK
ncbi:phosphopentomutase/2,3-bisphosphoglycerate-independent phosphoglycerate mutase family metalloenzyme [Aquimarina sp. MAR_2010_214]|uniref:alkaline phosphatase family protein n=1 Tax=Aquimarina sp. MAR_2010_214 TaxID=1250026 RepID=UPI000C70E95C|nr:alkaline phosphatase family protein [Aquimarina sp. MAR_2010_214]PKV53050.1 phosphopentomutase/2,3-bisphosphoglycerate-independent phosphoglycerate mutase family metalloenzyme [Aquimarina sp. MAR_2010_214]